MTRSDVRACRCATAQACLALMLAGCATTQHIVPVDVTVDVDRFATAFAPGNAILSGFDPPQVEQSWIPGDRALYGVLLDDGPKRTVWFVRVEVLTGAIPPGTRVPAVGFDQSVGDRSLRAEPSARDDLTAVAPDWGRSATLRDEQGATYSLALESGSIFVSLRVYDANATPVRTTYAFGPESFLRGGLFAQCQVLTRLYRTAPSRRVDLSLLSDDEMRSYVGGYFSLFAVGQTLWRTPEIGAIFEQIVPKPSLLSLVLNAGIRVNVAMGNRPPIPEASLPIAMTGGSTAYRLPMEVKINGEPSLCCDLLVLPPNPPVQVCAGLVGVEGAHVTDPNKRFCVRLLAARRGG